VVLNARTSDQALSTPGPALVEMNVDPNEPLLPPKRVEKYADNMEHALAQGTHTLSQAPGRAIDHRASLAHPPDTAPNQAKFMRHDRGITPSCRA
jgi:hypothetical protein